MTPDIERLDLTHAIVEDLDGSPDHPMDADVLSVVLSNHRHVEEVAVGLNLEEDDIIVCNGQAFRVRWPFDVERIGVVRWVGWERSQSEKRQSDRTSRRVNGLLNRYRRSPKCPSNIQNLALGDLYLALLWLAG
ncbi:hypothetical protein QCM77_43215 [Bradyrhizobium sp. SSUT18]|uniref:hypothetical protein n=1 Tax=Bradyrhizobium sp. SSUT18 TaxID=3040602 RepID=UPI00244D4D77|nr:hypothetical protein [Bradyrhizobium sp. SSUT18]MDH2406610.1 hypothetical protein [Bradyrhizobium sp. SSUT18]